MRKVVVYTLVSVDGVAESPDKFVFDFDEVMYDNLRAVIERQDAVLLGRRMYDEWADYWPTSDDEPFATFINNVRKYVVTSSGLGKEWANSTVVDGELRAFVAELKGQQGGDIGVHGSVELTRSLLREGLVDELRLVVSPAVAGSGRRLFASETDLTRLELLQVTASPSGAALLHYRCLS